MGLVFKRRHFLLTGLRWAIIPAIAIVLVGISAWSPRSKVAPPPNFPDDFDTTWQRKCERQTVARDVLDAANIMQTVKLAQLVAIKVSDPHLLRQTDSKVECTGTCDV